jgi:hypothetical protein
MTRTYGLATRVRVMRHLTTCVKAIERPLRGEMLS